MPRIPFDALPPHSRIWVFPASRALTEAVTATLLTEVDAFLDGWAAHGAPLRSARDFRHRHFLIVGVDEDAEAPSGCSIDALVGRLRTMGRELGMTLVEHDPVWYRQGDDVRVVSRQEMRSLAGDGVLDADTPVYDTSLTRRSALDESGLERPARETWHGRAFFGVPTRR
jgi:hypothetical protein